MRFFEKDGEIEWRNGKPTVFIRPKRKPSDEERIRRDLKFEKERYAELLEKRNGAVSKYDLENGYDWRFNLTLVRNHIAYSMMLLAELPGQTKLGNEILPKYYSPHHGFPRASWAKQTYLVEKRDPQRTLFG